MFPVLEIGEILGDQSTVNSDYNCELGRGSPFLKLVKVPR